MQVSRTTALAALVFVAVAVPVGAYALAGDDSGPDTSRHATHAANAKHDKDHDKDKAEGKSNAGHDGRGKGSDRADDASGPGRAHADAMRKWAHCVAEAAGGQKSGEQTGPPKDQCGDKPMPPGLAKRLSAGTEPFAPGSGRDQKAHPNSHAYPFG